MASMRRAPQPGASFTSNAAAVHGVSLLPIVNRRNHVFAVCAALNGDHSFAARIEIHKRDAGAICFEFVDECSHVLRHARATSNRIEVSQSRMQWCAALSREVDDHGGRAMCSAPA